MRALLDVNVLIALLDRVHLHHQSAVNWFRENITHGWASCPITQLGCIRVMSNPRYPNTQPAAAVAARLREAAASTYHQFWPAAAQPLDHDGAQWNQVLRHREVTDLYLLTLAVMNKGRLVTFDRHVPWQKVRNAEAENLCVIGS